jgi:hypothetical protein
LSGTGGHGRAEYAGCSPLKNNRLLFIKSHQELSQKKISLIGRLASEIDQFDIKTYIYNDPLLSKIKWGILLNSNEVILNLINTLYAKGEMLSKLGFYVGQGLNLSSDYEVDSSIKQAYSQIKNAFVPFMTKYDGAPFNLKKTAKYLLDKNQLSDDMCRIVKKDEHVKLFDSELTNKKPPLLILPRGIGRHYCTFNAALAYSSSAVDIYCGKETYQKDTVLNLWVFLNSSVAWLIREISGRKNLGGGMLKAEAVDLKVFPIYLDLGNQSKRIEKLFDRMSGREALNIFEEINTPEHQDIDEMVFDYLDISSKNRKNILQALANLVSYRSNKART